MEKRQLLILLVVIVGFSSTAMAVSIEVPNGDFAVYKPGTSIRGTCPGDIWVQQIGYNRPLSSTTPVPFDDGTSGLVIDCPGWITPIDLGNGATNACDLFSLGFDNTDGTTVLNTFGAWSGQNGGLAESEVPLFPRIVGPRAITTISAMALGNPEPRIFDLRVNGVIIEPDSQVDVTDYTEWQEISRTYSSIPAGDMTILVGTPRPEEGDPDLTGSRLQVDNISLDITRLPYPPDGSTVSTVNPLTMTWPNWTPFDPNDSVYVDVWFGTDPNEASPGYDMELLVLDPVSGQDVTSVDVDVSVPGTYYWRVNSYLYGDPEIVNYDTGDPNDPNTFIGELWSYTSVIDLAPEVVINTPPQMTWSGEPVLLDATVTNDGPSVIEWFADPADGVVITDNYTETPTVTITKDTDDPSTVTMTVQVSDVAHPIPDSDSVEIDVYDDACAMARIGEGKDNSADLNTDCAIDIDDLDLQAATWLYTTGLEGPAASNDQSEPNMVINGDFAFYKPGTKIRSVPPLAGEIWVQTIGLNQPITANGPINFEDGTSLTNGDPVDIPGWITPVDLGNGATAVVQAWSNGYDTEDGSSAANSFGAWSSQNGNLAISDAPLALPYRGPAGAVYKLSAMVHGDPLPRTFDLLVNDVNVPPISSVDPPNITEWQEISRTYDSIPLGDARILFGTARPGEGDPPLTGSRLRFDNIIIVLDPNTVLDENLPSVDAGENMVTWSGEPVPTSPTVTNNDTQVPQRTLSYLWTAYPQDGVVFDPGASGDPNTSTALAPTVTITKPAGDKTSVRLELCSTVDDVSYTCDTLTIEVYDDACLAGVGSSAEVDYDLGDLNLDCITNLNDFAIVAAAWLDDYPSSGPADRLEE